jgi:hypothetical protein
MLFDMKAVSRADAQKVFAMNLRRYAPCERDFIREVCGYRRTEPLIRELCKARSAQYLHCQHFQICAGLENTANDAFRAKLVERMQGNAIAKSVSLARRRALATIQ